MAWTFGSTDKIYWVDPGAGPNVGCVAFWMKTSQATANVTLLTHCGATSRQGWLILLNSPAGKISAQGYASSAQQVNLVSTSTLNDGNPHHIAFNFNRNSAGSNQLYIDGSSQASANSSASWTFGGTGQFYEAGKNLDTFWAGYVGDVWGVGHWNVQLTGDEISALAKGFAPKLVRPTGLTAYMPLVRDPHEVRSAATINSQSGSVANHGRILGSAI